MGLFMGHQRFSPLYVLLRVQTPSQVYSTIMRDIWVGNMNRTNLVKRRRKLASGENLGSWHLDCEGM
jgi:hypothetical protein